MTTNNDVGRAPAGLAAGHEGCSLSLAEMVAMGRYDRVVADITEKNFPVNPDLFTTEGTHIFYFRRFFLGMDPLLVTAAIRREGYEPDPIEKLLAFGVSSISKHGFYRVIALGSSSRECFPMIAKEGDFSSDLCLYSERFKWVNAEGPTFFIASPAKR